MFSTTYSCYMGNEGEITFSNTVLRLLAFPEYFFSYFEYPFPLLPCKHITKYSLFLLSQVVLLLALIISILTQLLYCNELYDNGKQNVYNISKIIIKYTGTFLILKIKILKKFDMLISLYTIKFFYEIWNKFEVFIKKLKQII